MTRKYFYTCVGVTAAILFLALLGLMDRPAGDWQPGRAGSPLVVDLDDAAVARITLSRGEETTDLRRTETGWQVASRHGFPADEGRVAALISGIANSDIIAAKTALPERHARLDLADPGAEKGAGRRIVLYGTDDAVLADLILGRTRGDLVEVPGRTGSYVRRTGDAQSWLVTGTVTRASGWLDFVDAELIHVPAEDVAAVTVQRGDVHWTFARSADGGDLAYTGPVPDGREVAAGLVARLGSALSRLAFADVAPAPADAPAPDAITEVTRIDGSRLTVHQWPVADGQGGAWITLSGAGAADVPAGWRYRIGGYPAERLAPQADALFTPAPDAE